MRLLLSAFITLLAAFPFPIAAQNVSSNNIEHARKAYIEMEATNLSSDAVHLALSASKLGWTEDKGSADLIMKFDRQVASTAKSQQGTQIKVGINWNYTLVATLPDGTIVAKFETPDDLHPRTDRSEQGWVSYLRTTSEYKLTNELLAKFHLK